MSVSLFLREVFSLFFQDIYVYLQVVLALSQVLQPIVSYPLRITIKLHSYVSHSGITLSFRPDFLLSLTFPPQADQLSIYTAKTVTFQFQSAYGAPQPTCS